MKSCDSASDLPGAVQCLSDVITLLLDSRYATTFNLELPVMSGASAFCDPLATVTSRAGSALHQAVLDHVDYDTVHLLALPADARRIDVFAHTLYMQLAVRIEPTIVPFFFQSCLTLPYRGSRADRVHLAEGLR